MAIELYINPDKIISVAIVEPNKNTGEPWDISESHEWRLVLLIGFTNEGYPIKEIVEKKQLKDISNILLEIKKHIELVNID